MKYKNTDFSRTPYGFLLGEHSDNQIYIFNDALLQWLQRPQLEQKYNFLNLKFYDGLIGYVIEKYNRDFKNKEYMSQDNLHFMNTWKYNGKIYRVIDANLNEIKYHNMIASWTKSIDAFDSFNHLYKSEKYTFLIADTKDNFGFDVNKYKHFFGVENDYIQHEKEIIFPMNESYVVDKFYGTLAEFKKYVASKKENTNA